MLREASQALERSRGEVEDLRHGLERARARERRAAAAVEEERRAALEKITELEGAIERSEREHGLLRERTEGRLELLRSAMEQEEQENSSQVRVWERGGGLLFRGHTFIGSLLLVRPILGRVAAPHEDCLPSPPCSPPHPLRTNQKHRYR